MKDKSKRLTVVNTEKKPSEKKEVQQVIVQPSSSSSSHAPGFNPNLYLLKSVWDSVFEIKTDGSGQKYIFGKLPVVTKYGITMYADDGNVDIPQLAEGLPFDQRTIWFNPETKQIEVIGGTGGGEGGVSNFWDLSGIPSWITNSKPIYSYSEIKNTPDLSVFITDTELGSTLADYATLSYLTGELKEYVTLDGEQDITGVKDFINGLKIGGLPITKKQGDVVYLDANLVVRGGITMYGDGEGGSSVPLYSTLGSLLNVDESNDAVASVDRVLFQSAGSNVWSWKALSEIGGGSSGGGSVSGDYLPLSGGTLTASVAPQLKIVNNGNTDAYITMTGSNGYSAHAGMVKLPTIGDAASFGYSERIVFPITGGMYYRNGYNGGNQAILHAGNYSSYALPLSGGTLTGTLTIAPSNGQSLISERASGVPYISFRRSSSEYYGHIGVNSSGDPIMQSTVKGSTAWEKIWYEGNDGSGSGLDADLLDGIHAAFMFYARGKVITSSNVNSLMDNGVYYTAGYAPISGAYGYGTFLNFRSNAVGINSRQAQFYIVDGAQVERGGRIYFRDSWNSTDDITTPWYEIITSKRIGEYNAGSATKLQTARTIWGQSFDGTGNISGHLSVGSVISQHNEGRAELSVVSSGDLPSDLMLGNQGNARWSISARSDSSSNSKSLIVYGYDNAITPMVIGSDGATSFHNISAGIIGLYRLSAGGGAYIDYYASNQTSKKWRVGSANIYTFAFESQEGEQMARFAYNTTTGKRFEIGKDFLTVSSQTDPKRATLTLITTTDNPTDFIMGANAYDWSITARGSSDDYFLGIYSNRNSQYVTKFFRGGNVLVTGGITMYSDQRKKTILNHVELSLKQIADAPLIEHYYNSDQEKTTHVGSIAQYWAGINDWFCKLDNEGFYTMEIQNCALASAISIARHLEKYESKTDKKIRQLKKRISQLEDELELLKKGV